MSRLKVVLGVIIGILILVAIVGLSAMDTQNVDIPKAFKSLYKNSNGDPFKMEVDDGDTGNSN